jgi:hypothetical protein
MNMTLDESVASRLPGDDLEVTTDRFLERCDRIESLLTPTPDGQYCKDEDAYRDLNFRKAQLHLRLDSIFRRRKAMGLLDDLSIEMAAA